MDQFNFENLVFCDVNAEKAKKLDKIIARLEDMEKDMPDLIAMEIREIIAEFKD